MTASINVVLRQHEPIREQRPSDPTPSCIRRQVEIAWKARRTWRIRSSRLRAHLRQAERKIPMIAVSRVSIGVERIVTRAEVNTELHLTGAQSGHPDRT